MSIQSLKPHLVVRDAAETIEFYKRAFGAAELCRAPMPDGKIMHAELEIGGAKLMLNDEFPQMGARSPLTVGGTSVTMNLSFDSVEQVDTAWKRAVDAGAKVTMPIDNQFFGRYGIVTDGSGHQWAFHAELSAAG